MRGFFKTKTCPLVLAVLLLTAAGLIFHYRMQQRAGPAYKGIALAVWLDRSENPLQRANLEEIYKAIRCVSREGVPCLISRLNTKETVLDMAYGRVFAILPKRAQNSLPTPLNKALRLQRRNSAANSLRYSGSNGIPSIPMMLDPLTKPESKSFQESILCALGAVAPSSKYEQSVVQLLIGFTTNQDNSVRRAAYVSLGNFHEATSQVLPVMMKGLEYYGSQGAAMDGLVLFGTNGISAVKAALEHESGYPKPAQVVIDKIMAHQESSTNR
jgi:hypothetical protein